MGVGNFDQALAAKSPLEGVREDSVRLRMDSIPLHEHVEVQPLGVATVAHFHRAPGDHTCRTCLG